MGDKHEQRQRSGSAAAEKLLIHGLRSKNPLSKEV